MAINTQKLLPSAKGSPLAKISAAKIVPAISIKKKSIDTQKLLGSKKDEPGQIVKTLTDIDVRLKLLLKEEQTQQGKKRKEKEKVDFEKQEKKLEAPKETKKFNLPTLSLPGASFLDRIKRFLFFTALGWLFTKFQDQLPKLEGVLKTVTQVYGVAENIFKFLLGSFVNFIDRGYKTYDKVRDLAKSIGGEKAQQEFDNLSGKLNEYINYALIGGMALTGAINAFSNEVKGRKAKDGGRTGGYTSGYAAGYAAGLASRKGGPRYRAPGEAAAGRTLGENVSRQRLTRERMLKPEGPRGPLDRVRRGFRGAAAQLETGTLFKRGAGAQRALYNLPGKAKNLVPAKQLLKVVKGPLSRLPILGGLIEFGLSWALGDPVGKAAFRGVGTLLLGAVGSLILPGFGTFIGGWAGAELAGKLYEVLFENKQPKGKVQKKQGGGSVTRGGKTQSGPSRSLKIARRRPPKVKPKQSQPGKDVGGKKKIRELYPDPSVRTDIEGEQKGAWWNLLPPLPKNATAEQIQQRDDKIKALPNSYKALTGVAKILKDIPFGIGALMGGAVDIALGQKLPSDAINNLSNGVSYLINAIANRQVSASISSIEKEITKMQTGGAVPRLKDFTNRDEFGLGKDISKVLDGTIRQKVDEAIREVQKQLMPGKYGRGGAPGGPGGGGGGGGGGAGPYGAPPRLGPGGPITTVPGIVDQKGRPVKFASTAAAAFILMMEDAKKEKKPFKGSDIASTYRDPELNKAVGGAENSPHLYGLAADIHGTTGAWIRSKGKDYGWVPYDYKGTHGGHYEYIGGGKKEKPVKTLPDIFKLEPKQQPGQLSKIFEQKPKQQLPSIFQLPGQKPTISSGVFLTGVYKKAADIIAGYESSSSGGYNAMNRGRGGDSPEGPKKYFGRNLTDMTLGEVLSLQSKGSLNAAGRYQFVGNTLPSAMRNAGLRSSDKFSSVNQDKMFLFTLQQSGHGPWTGPWGLGKYSKEELKLLDEAVKKIRKEGPQGPQKPGYGGNMQGGGLIPKQSPRNRSSSLSMYPSYSAEGGMMIAIQPMIIEKTIPVPSGNRGGGGAVVFPIAGVNNSNMQSLSRG